VAILGIVVAWTIAPPIASDLHETSWASMGAALGFGGVWYQWVARPIYLALMFGWLWRLVVTTVFCARVARLPLSLVPTHPDRLGGLGFLERIPIAFAPVILAISAVFGSRWAHDVVYHGVHVTELRLPAAGFLVLVTVVFLAPLAVFMAPLARSRRQALFDYGALVGAHGRLVRRRWVLGESVETDLLAAPEIGPVADTIAIYEAVEQMRTSPIGRRTLILVLVPAVLPLVAVAGLEIPLKDVLLTVLKAVA
jgi:hypothetical protein